MINKFIFNIYLLSYVPFNAEQVPSSNLIFHTYFSNQPYLQELKYV